jgi:hypothetical protein
LNHAKTSRVVGVSLWMLLRWSFVLIRSAPQSISVVARFSGSENESMYSILSLDLFIHFLSHSWVLHLRAYLFEIAYYSFVRTHR